MVCYSLHSWPNNKHCQILLDRPKRWHEKFQTTNSVRGHWSWPLRSTVSYVSAKEWVKVATLQKQLFHCRVCNWFEHFRILTFVLFFQQSVRPRELLLWNLSTFVYEVSLFPVFAFPIVGKTPSFQNSWIFPKISIVPIGWYFMTRLSNKHETNKPIVIDKWLSLCECHVVGFIIRLMYVFVCWCWHHHFLFILFWYEWQ